MKDEAVNNQKNCWNLFRSNIRKRDRNQIACWFDGQEKGCQYKEGNRCDYHHNDDGQTKTVFNYKGDQTLMVNIDEFAKFLKDNGSSAAEVEHYYRRWPEDPKKRR